MPGLSINTNIPANLARRQLGIASKRINGSLEGLASGLRRRPGGGRRPGTPAQPAAQGGTIASPCLTRALDAAVWPFGGRRRARSGA